jgi:WD40 repeat protein/serine/threonine protein kinase
MSDSLLMDQRRRWEQGDRILVEAYLENRPGLRGQAEEVLELIEHEILLRQERQETPQLDEYLRRFPDLAADLRLHFEVHAALQADPHWAPTFPKVDDSPARDGLVLPGYEVLGELGRGGMGVVYKARQIGLNRLVAVKMILTGLHAGPQEVARFRREAEAVAQLQHPNIVQIYEVGEAAGRPFLALEYVDGGSLERLAAGRPQPAEAAAKLVETLARAMDYAHHRGVVHRDLKPANILLMRNGECGMRNEGPGDSSLRIPHSEFRIPKITDFGLAKLLDTGASGPTKSGDLLGTPSYMAPEQVEGPTVAIGPATDVWALGAILYELLTGGLPFKGESPLETLMQVRFPEPVSPSRLQPKLPRDLVTICMTCLHKQPHKRYAGAADLADDLQRFLRREPIRARRISSVERAVKWARRRPAVAALLALIVLVTVTSLAVFFELWQRAEEGWRNAESERDAKDLAYKREQAQRHERDFQLYLNRVALAQHELLANNVGRANQLLDDCPPEFRQWEWWHLRRRCHPDVYSLSLPPPAAQVGDVAFSPDGRWIAALRRDHTLVVSDAASREVRYTTALDPGRYETWMLGVAFSPTGRHLAVADQDSLVRVCDAATGGNLRAFAGHLGPVTHVAFSPDGQRLASVSDDGKMRVWDVRTGQAIHVLTTGHGRTIGVAWSPAGTMGATGGDDGKVRLWDLTDGKELRTLPGHRSMVLTVRFSPDGRFLASGGWDGLVKIWNTVTGTEVHTLSGHAAPVWSVAFSPDGLHVASAGFDGGLKIWNAWSGDELFRLSGQSGPVNGVGFSPDGRLLAAGGDDYTVRVWDATREREVVEMYGSGWLYSVAFNPVDRHIVASGGNNQDVKVWDTRTAATRHIFGGLRGEITTVVFSADGQRLAAANNRRQAKVWDLRTGKEIAPSQGRLDGVVALAFSPEGQLLGVVGEPERVTMHDLLSGQDLFRVSEDGRSIQGAAFSEDGVALATADSKGTVTVWNTLSGRDVLTLPASAAAAPETRLAFSRDRSRLAVVTAPDPSQLAPVTAKKEVTLWDLATGRLTASCQGHAGRVRGLAFSADGRRLATAGHDDMTVKLWDTSTGEEALTLRGHKDHLQGVAFSADDQRLALVGWQGVVKVWDAVPRDRETPEERLRELDDETPAWHAREAKNAETLRAWFGAIFHLDAMIQANPENGPLYGRRGHAHAELGKWEPALADFTTLVERQPADVEARYQQALAQLAAGQVDAYRATCAAMLQRFHAGPSAVRILFPCVPVAGAADPAALGAHVERLELGDGHERIRGAVSYRTGRFAEAIRCFEKWERQGQTLRAWDYLFLAMAHHAEGHIEKAHSAFTEALVWIDKADRHEKPGNEKRMWFFWRERVEVEALRREAEILLNGKG